MNIYEVTYRLKGAQYDPGDLVNGPRSYDIYETVIITASSKERAKKAVEKMLSSQDWPSTVKVTLLGEA